MKLYHDYKKQFNFLIIVLFLTLPVFFSFAQTAEELSNKIDQKNEEIKKLEKEIKVFQSELGELAQQKNSLSRAEALLLCHFFGNVAEWFG